MINLWLNKLYQHLGGYHFLPNRGVMKKQGSQNFFMWNRGVTKKSRDYWVATNFNENLFNEIAPKMHIFRTTRIGGYMFLQHCSSGGGHKIFDHQIRGSQKYCRGTFRNSWPPYSKENGPLRGSCFPQYDTKFTTK